MRSGLMLGAAIAGAIALAGLVHIAVILLLPSLAPTDPWTRLGRFETAPGFQLLPEATPDAAPLRLMDPATVVLVCRYDLDEDDTVRVTGRANVPYWGLSVHTRQGAAFYTINSRALGQRPLDLRLTTPQEVARLRSEQPEDAEQALLIGTPQPRGFVLVRALVPQPSARPRVEAELRQLRCEPAE